ncbi:hypothetical protein BC1002_0150 [Paraburkholderia atlantica]|uniref:Uncharacterized protein n=1 Tax=Paraburkholderia atlantica TaxID=2654982 RepID=D5WA36_PARAM|nr:hypothetical protein [Paraburkholderia atlantica]ADG14258.1 hypothetical protein BC1002_0150 [Paraburkholderia atlantica]
MTTSAETMIETLKSSQAELVAMRKDVEALREHLHRMIGNIEFCLREVEKNVGRDEP